jgi:hypothetical protein
MDIIKNAVKQSYSAQLIRCIAAITPAMLLSHN